MKRVKKIINFFGVLFLLILTVFLVFLFKNQAPITKGGISFHVPYNKEKKLDLYAPTKKVYEKSPVLVYVHGGAFFFGTKSALNNNHFNKAFNLLRDKGYTIVSPQYSYARKNSPAFPKCIKDVNECLNWLVNNSDSLGIDSSNIGIIGESAGSHIAMMNTFGNIEFEKKASLKYIIDIYGPTELWSLYNSKTPRKVEQKVNKIPELFKENVNLPKFLFGFNPRTDTNKTICYAQRYSPLNQLCEKDTIPKLIIHGLEDNIVPFSQSILLTQKLDSLNLTYEFHSLDHTGHAFSGINKTQRDSVQNWVSEFVLRNYKNPNKI